VEKETKLTRKDQVEDAPNPREFAVREELEGVLDDERPNCWN
jgi:hypothetical protein